MRFSAATCCLRARRSSAISLRLRKKTRSAARKAKIESNETRSLPHLGLAVQFPKSPVYQELRIQRLMRCVISAFPMRSNLRASRALIAIVLMPPISAAADWTVYLRRAGPVRIGMSLAQVQRVLRDPSARLEGNTPEVPLNKCAYLDSKSIPDGLGFMFAGGRVVRIDVFKAGIKTASGAEVGDTEARIKQLYSGHISIEPHHYDREGHYLNFSPVTGVERKYGAVFETDGVKVTSSRTGTLAATALVEGCS